VPRYTASYTGSDIHNTYKGEDYPGDSPKTGDDSNPTLWTILMIASLIMLVAVIVIGRKKKYIGKYYA